MDRSADALHLVEELLTGSEYEVVDVLCTGSSRGPLVRVLIDKEEGVSIDDCTRVSRAVGDQLDQAGLFPGRYTLEVSSPGVERPLRREKDFVRFAGETIALSTYEKIDGRHKHQGVLAGFDAERGEVLLREEEETIAIPLGAIRKANLKRDPWERRRSR